METFHPGGLVARSDRNTDTVILTAGSNTLEIEKDVLAAIATEHCD